ncbi:unnamed protein product [Ranitomeya imitator]|uniref:Uncharacterized protein n=1 Tax=Ranitomeya imitator TaxID=111125 RepID=A0ABN9MEJ3_9NEOB|nr:unnamed protein product [Ranitomeya imitator]
MASILDFIFAAVDNHRMIVAAVDDHSMIFASVDDHWMIIAAVDDNWLIFASADDHWLIFTATDDHWVIVATPDDHWMIFNSTDDHWMLFAAADDHWMIFTTINMNKECQALAEESGVSLPKTFSLEQVFHGLFETGELNKPFLKAATTLRNHGFKTCVLTNNWVDDSPLRHHTADIFSTLSRHFDLVIESCRVGMRKPETRIYEYALKMMKAKPEETIFLDDIGANLKPARALGMSTVLVRDTEKALQELQELSGVQLLDDDVLPPAADLNTVSHGYVPIKV